MFKIFGGASLLVFALIGLAVASSAMAGTVHIESCTKEEKECKTASVGTTFELESEKFVLEGKEEEPNECQVTLAAEITDSTSKGAEDPLKYLITSIKYSECTVEGLKAEKLPWTLESDAPTFEKTETFTAIPPVLIRTTLGCKYSIWPPTHTYSQRWEIGLLTAALYKKEDDSPWYCFASLKHQMEEDLTYPFLYNDPSLVDAVMVRVQ